MRWGRGVLSGMRVVFILAAFDDLGFTVLLLVGGGTRDSHCWRRFEGRADVEDVSDDCDGLFGNGRRYIRAQGVAVPRETSVIRIVETVLGTGRLREDLESNEVKSFFGR